MQRTDRLKYLQQSYKREEQDCPLVQVRWELQRAIYDTKTTTAHYSGNSDKTAGLVPLACKKAPEGDCLLRSLRKASEVAGLRSPLLALCHYTVVFLVLFDALLHHMLLALLCDLLLLCSSLGRPSRVVNCLPILPPSSVLFFLVSLLSSLVPNEAVLRRSYCYPTCLTECLTDCHFVSVFAGGFCLSLRPQRSSTSSAITISPLLPNRLQPFLYPSLTDSSINTTKPYAAYYYRRQVAIIIITTLWDAPVLFSLLV